MPRSRRKLGARKQRKFSEGNINDCQFTTRDTSVLSDLMNEQRDDLFDQACNKQQTKTPTTRKNSMGFLANTFNFSKAKDTASNLFSPRKHPNEDESDVEVQLRQEFRDKGATKRRKSLPSLEFLKKGRKLLSFSGDDDSEEDDSQVNSGIKPIKGAIKRYTFGPQKQESFCRDLESDEFWQKILCNGGVIKYYPPFDLDADKKYPKYTLTITQEGQVASKKEPEELLIEVDEIPTRSAATKKTKKVSLGQEQLIKIPSIKLPSSRSSPDILTKKPQESYKKPYKIFSDDDLPSDTNTVIDVSENSDPNSDEMSFSRYERETDELLTDFPELKLETLELPELIGVSQESEAESAKSVADSQNSAGDSDEFYDYF